MLRWRLRVVVLIAVSVGSLGGPPVAQAFLGASAADLVYTPVAPCRIIDTRVAGGPIVPGVPRDFLVSGTVNFELQGGTAGGCGIPEGATGAMLNFVAVNPGGAGDLRAWPFGQAVPGASVVNYGLAGSGLNLANGVVVPLCNPATATCTFDVSVQADVSGTQLVVDVLGFLQSTAPRSATVGTANTFLGDNAGNFTTTGTHNTATGVAALLSNRFGNDNTATGIQALAANTDGNSNTATGAGALKSNTTGGLNTATGLNALQSNTTSTFNTATGARALQSTTGGGGGNTATGADALSFNTTGFNNTAIGVGALESNTTGGNNTAVGASTNVSSGALTNATAIGFQAVVNASNKIRLGNASVTVIEGQVGFTSSSDATQKEHFQPVDGETVLGKLREFVLTSWNFIGHDPGRFRHYGPSAQEFFAAFGHDGVGTIGTPTTITSTDLIGILMIAVQALEKRTAEAAELKAETAELKEKARALETASHELEAKSKVIDALTQRLERLERLTSASPTAARASTR